MNSSLHANGECPVSGNPLLTDMVCVSTTAGRCGTSAFTLLEILVAVVIFGIIMLTIFASFRSFMVSAAMIKDEMRASETESAITNLMVRDFLSLRIALAPEYSRPVSDSKDETDIFRFTGEETTEVGNIFSRLRFVSLSHIAFGEDGPKSVGAAQIIYYIRHDGEQKFNLCRSDTLNAFDKSEGNGCDPVICRDVTQFKVTYMDLEGEEHQFWDSESDEFGYATPLSVAIDMEFRSGDSLHKFSTTISMPLSRPPVK